MYKPTLTQQDYDETYAIFRKEQPQINGAALKMAKQMKGLSDIGQKQAMCKLLADFVMWVYPDDLEKALALSEAMREQVDIYIRTKMDGEFKH